MLPQPNVPACTILVFRYTHLYTIATPITRPTGKIPALKHTHGMHGIGITSINKHTHTHSHDFKLILYEISTGNSQNLIQKITQTLRFISDRPAVIRCHVIKKRFFLRQYKYFGIIIRTEYEKVSRQKTTRIKCILNLNFRIAAFKTDAKNNQG